MEDMSILVKGLSLKFENEDFTIQDQIVKEGIEVSIYELNKKKIKTYSPHPN